MVGPNLHLNDTIGCFFAGTIFATLLYGCTCGQGLYYLSEYPDDRRMIKAMVLILWGLDTTTTVTDSMLIWDYLVRGHQIPADLATMPSIGSIHHLFASTTICLVQLYYVVAVWKLMYARWSRWILAAVLGITSLATYTLAIVIVYISLHDPTIEGVYTMTRLESIVQPAISCITDIFITITLSLLLSDQRTGTISRYSRTDTLLRKLMVYAINRGIFTALVQSLQVILYATSSSTKVFFWALFYFPGCKVYVNSTFAMLNARHHVRQGGVTFVSTGFELHAYPADVISGSDSTRGSILPEFSKHTVTASEAKIDCKVTTEIVRQVD